MSNKIHYLITINLLCIFLSSNDPFFNHASVKIFISLHFNGQSIQRLVGKYEVHFEVFFTIKSVTKQIKLSLEECRSKYIISQHLSTRLNGHTASW